MALRAYCLSGHEAIVRSVAFSQDSRRVVSASGHFLHVWDLQDGSELQRLQSTEDIERVAYSADGKAILGEPHYAGKVFVWRSETGEYLGAAECEGTHPAFCRWSDCPIKLYCGTGGDTLFESISTKKHVAWFPAALWHSAMHTSRRTWAGTEILRGHVHILSLAGGAPT